jgi:hypothetical protein
MAKDAIPIVVRAAVISPHITRSTRVVDRRICGLKVRFLPGSPSRNSRRKPLA